MPEEFTLNDLAKFASCLMGITIICLLPLAVTTLGYSRLLEARI